MHEHLKRTSPARRGEREVDTTTNAMPAEDAVAPLTPGVGFNIGSISIFPPAPEVGPEGGVLGADLSGRIQAKRGDGAPLEPTVQRRMEGAFGHHFGDVRIHADGESDTLSRSLGARAFTLGSDIYLGREATGAGPYGGDTLLAHELTHVIQQRGQQRGGLLAVGAAGDLQEREAEEAAAAVTGGVPRHHVARMPAPAAVHRQSVQRDIGDGKAKTMPTAEMMVQTALDQVFDNQKTGLHRLDAALNKDAKPDNNLIADIAAAAVGAAIGALFGPVAPAVLALVKVAGAEVAEQVAEKEAKTATEKLVEKAVDAVKEKAQESAKKCTEEWVAGKKKTDPIDNFIEAQDLALNQAKKDAKMRFLGYVDDLNGLPGGPALLQGMATIISARADLAQGLQIAESAGAWARLVAKEGHGSDSRQWANDDVEDHPEKGAIEIDARVQNAPLTGASDIQIIKSNWQGIRDETMGTVQEHMGATIRDLGVNLRITVETPWGETRCEISPHAGTPTIPEKSALQGVMIWLIKGGQMNPSPLPDERATAMGGAALLGYYMMQKSVTELNFG